MDQTKNKPGILIIVLSLLSLGLIVGSLIVEDSTVQWVFRIAAFLLIIVLSAIRLKNLEGFAERFRADKKIEEKK